MMMTYQKTVSTLKKLFVISAAVCSLASCQDDELTNVSESASVAQDVVESNVPSLTISGEHTQFVASLDCNTCSFVVDPTTETIDGKELGLKAGSIICLQTGVKYSNLNFVNLIGTAQNPIIIGQCK